MAEDTNFLVDLSLITPPKKVFRLVGGEYPVEVDISVFPARAMLKFMQVMQGHKKGDAPSIEEMVAVVAEACKPKNPGVTEDWLFNNLTFNQLADFCGLVMEYGQSQMNDYHTRFTPKGQGTSGESKNSLSQPSSSMSAKSSHGRHQNTASKK
jgi:hypothetical protein